MMTGQFCVGLWRLKCWSLVLMSQYFHFSKQNNIFCQYALFSCVLGRFADFLGKCIILMKIFLLYTHVCGRSKVESPSLDVYPRGQHTPIHERDIPLQFTNLSQTPHQHHQLPRLTQTCLLGVMIVVISTSLPILSEEQMLENKSTRQQLP